MSLPTSGNLSIKSAAGTDRCIACEVDGDETGNKNLTTLANSANFSLPVAITDFYGYPPANLSVSPTSVSIGYNGTSSYTLTVTSDVNWSANVTSGSSYVSITSGSTGSNDGTITFSMTENTDKNNYHYATITVSDDDGNANDVAVNITQAKAQYVFSIIIDFSDIVSSSSTDTYTVDADCTSSSTVYTYVWGYKSGASSSYVRYSIEGWVFDKDHRSKSLTLDLTSVINFNETAVIETIVFYSDDTIMSSSNGELALYDKNSDAVSTYDVDTDLNGSYQTSADSLSLTFTFDTLNSEIKYKVQNLDDSCW